MRDVRARVTGDRKESAREAEVSPGLLIDERCSDDPIERRQPGLQRPSVDEAGEPNRPGLDRSGPGELARHGREGDDPIHPRRGIAVARIVEGQLLLESASAPGEQKLVEELDVIAAFRVGLADVASVGREPGPLDERKVDGVDKDTNVILPRNASALEISALVASRKVVSGTQRPDGLCPGSASMPWPPRAPTGRADESGLIPADGSISDWARCLKWGRFPI